MILHHALAFAPLMTIAGLYTLSWRVASLIGHWPRPSLDDPKFVAPNDALSDLLYFSVFPLVMWSVVGLLIFPLLTFFMRRVYPKVWTWLLVVLFVGSWLLLRADPGARFEWFAD